MTDATKLIYETKCLGSHIKVFSNRIVFNMFGTNEKSILIGQIASIELPLWGIWQITIETTGGQKHTITTRKKKEVRDAIYKAQTSLFPI